MTEPSRKPDLSLLVVIYRMSRQAGNTLRSLAVPYQQHVDAADYEIIVVENDSDDELGRESAEHIASNIRYYHRNEPGVSPVPALNFALGKARGHVLGIMIDGARMVTPGVVRYAQMAFRMDTEALVAVPGYHLGEEVHESVGSPEIFKWEEQRLLDAIEWYYEGYSLFDIACLSPANPDGYLAYLYESNCLFCPRTALGEIGGIDERFDLEGGGSYSLVLYAQLAARRQARLFVLAGEGSFHQYHGGVSTRAEGRAERLASHGKQLEYLLRGQFRGVNREPVMLGMLSGPALRFMEHSTKALHIAYSTTRKKGRVMYPLDQPCSNSETSA